MKVSLMSDTHFFNYSCKNLIINKKHDNCVIQLCKWYA